MANNIKIITGLNATLEALPIGNKQILLSKNTKNIYFDDNNIRYNINDKAMEGIYINDILKLPITDLYGLEEYVSEQINNLINGAGEAYDTLKELADYINENTEAITSLQEYTEDLVDGKIEWIILSDEVGVLVSSEMQVLITEESNGINSFLNVGI